ncbi:MAG TPA: hypothetical protein VFA21_14345 [Pyrinomonadaceae bacterium]|nr:hypothetical protein [Pyrinomonadaceae bacterium]
MHCRTRLFKRAAFVACAALTLTTLAAGAARAQVVTDTTRPNEVSTPVPPSDLSKLKEPRGDSRGSRPSYRDVEREFERLQLANRALVGLTGQGAATDYGRVRKEAAEVNNSASRLKDYLSLPKPDGEKKQRKAAEILSLDALSPAVASLDALVRGFVWNPALHQTGVVDSGKSVEASRDLEEIISLSERIRKCAEVLTKTPVKK